MSMLIGSFFSAHLKEAGTLSISQKVLPNNQASLHEKGEIVLAMKEGGKEGGRALAMQGLSLPSQKSRCNQCRNTASREINAL